MLRACVADTLVLAVMPEAAPTAGSRLAEFHQAQVIVQRRTRLIAFSRQ